MTRRLKLSLLSLKDVHYDNKSSLFLSSFGATYFIVALLPFITIPLIGDDFGSFLDPKLLEISSESIFNQLKSILELNSQSMHFNFLGQLVSLVWMKSCILLNGLGIADLNQIFYLTKFTIYAIFTLTIAFALSVFAKIRLKYSLILTFFILPIFLQVRAGWSNDPLSSTPFAGLLSVSFILFVIALFILKLHQLTSFRILLFTLLNIIGVLLYELNAVVLLMELAVLVPLVFRKNDQRLIHAKIMFLSNLVFGFLFVCTVYAKTSHISNSYTGTQFDTVTQFRQIKIVIQALLSVIPILSWEKSIELLGLSITEVAVMFLVSLILGLAIYKLVGVLELPDLTPSKTYLRILHLPLIILWAVPTITQSLTSKFQSESRGLFSVYIFVTYSLASITILASLYLLRFISSMGKQNILFGFIISVSFFQFLLNAGLSLGLHESYKENEAIIKTFSTESTNEKRCEVLAQWLDKSWPNYYRENLLISIDRYSIEMNGQLYCSKPTIIRTKQ